MLGYGRNEGRLQSENVPAQEARAAAEVENLDWLQELRQKGLQFDVVRVLGRQGRQLRLSFEEGVDVRQIANDSDPLPTRTAKDPKLKQKAKLVQEYRRRLRQSADLLAAQGVKARLIQDSYGTYLRLIRPNGQMVNAINIFPQNVLATTDGRFVIIDSN
jgi:hypothetical protein